MKHIISFVLGIVVAFPLASPGVTAHAQTSASVTVTKPSAGEVLTAGQPYTIRWISTGLSPNATLGIFLSDIPRGIPAKETIAQSVLASQGSFRWTPSCRPSCSSIPHYVFVFVEGKSSVIGGSGGFKIVSPAVSPLPDRSFRSWPKCLKLSSCIVRGKK